MSISLYQDKQETGYFDNVRMDALKFLRGKAKTVLEIGCGAGATLAYLKKNNLAERVVGIDINELQLAKAQDNGVDETYISDLSDIEKIFLGRKFDQILMLDVLEHLVDPWDVVRRVSNFLSDGGKVLVSVPNVQNLRVVVPLIFGQWNYLQCGILDKTHLRFFTKRTAVSLLQDNGFTVESIHHNIESHLLPSVLNLLTFGLCKRFVTVQYIVVASKASG